MHQDLWDQIWRDKHGDLVIWQRPNLPLIAWAVLTTLSLFFTGKTADLFSAAGSAALIIWSLLEVFQGASYFRRALGAVVLVFSVMSLIKAL